MTTVNGIELVVKPLPSGKMSLKATNTMKAKGYTLHNTYNDATALNEISYMQNVNPLSTSYTYAVDNLRVVQGLPLDRNGWHAGDGGNGYGNRNTWGVEICYSKSGGERYDQAETNAILFVAHGLFKNGWDVSKVWKHQDWSGKNCPHRILARTRGWEGIIAAIQRELDRLKEIDKLGKPIKPEAKPKPPTNTKPKAKSISQMASEVEALKHGNGHDKRRKSLGISQAEYNKVRAEVNRRAGIKATPKPKPKSKTISQMADEVIAKKHGNGHDYRRKSLGISQAQYDKVRAEVNRRAGVTASSKKPTQSISQMANRIITDKKAPTGHEARRKWLGIDNATYQKVRAEVNKRM